MLEIKDLYYSANKKYILKNLNLNVKRGIIHSILGVNGTGKTTLGFMLMGLSGYKPQEGKIIFDGIDITNLSITERARLGLTLAWQHSTPFEGITIKDYLTIASRSSSFDYKYALEKLGLNPSMYLERNYDETLSGGERKRVELAAIMSMKPKFAILDEPDSGIDALSIQSIADVIKELNQTGITILLITHRWEIAKISDISSVLCDGNILLTADSIKATQFFINKCQKCNHINLPKMEEIINASD